jgi:hypothetical protein
MNEIKFSKEYLKKLKSIDEKIMAESREGDLDRARSITVGTAFGGTAELSMRRNDGRTTWVLLQPVEVIELIHQLAANVGCHIQLKPRQDFASWRGWVPSNDNAIGFDNPSLKTLAVEDNPPMAVPYDTGIGFPATVSEEEKFIQQHKGTKNLLPEEQPGLNIKTTSRRDKDETMATKKTINKRSSKRASRAS